jgi:Arc/MetJ family transcription regulator
MKDIPGYLEVTPRDFKEFYRLAFRHALERITHSFMAKDMAISEFPKAKPLE